MKKSEIKQLHKLLVEEWHPGEEFDPNEPYWDSEKYKDPNYKRSGKNDDTSKNNDAPAGSTNLSHDKKSNWFYAVDKKPVGPFMLDDFIKMMADHIVDPKTLVWHTGMKDWVPYGKFSLNKFLKESSELHKLITKVITEVFNEGSLPDGISPKCIIPLDQFVKQEVTEDTDMLGAKTTPLPPEEMQSYLGRIKSGEKTPTDKFKYPYIHQSNIPIKDAQGRVFDLEKLKSAIMDRPKKILKQNDKITHSGGDATVYFNIGLPALKGLAINEKTGEFIVVDTCPGAGACKVYCYARKGGYIQYAPPSMSQTKLLNFLVNDPEGFKAKLADDLKTEETKYKKKSVKLVVRWHDAGDFFSPEYLDLAYRLAKEFPEVDFYAYTKMASVAMGARPSNFKTNFSGGATPDQEKQIDFEKAKHSIVVPKQMFDDLIKKDARGRLEKDKDGKSQWATPESVDTIKKRLAAKHKLKLDSMLTYDELMVTPIAKDKKYNVIVKPGDGDDSANRGDVLGTYLLIH